jgi:hypothetical protein
MRNRGPGSLSPPLLQLILEVLLLLLTLGMSLVAVNASNGSLRSLTCADQLTDSLSPIARLASPKHDFAIGLRMDPWFEIPARPVSDAKTALGE